MSEVDLDELFFLHSIYPSGSNNLALVKTELIARLVDDSIIARTLELLEILDKVVGI